MVDLIGTPNAKKRRRASALQVATTIYGLLYLYFFIWSFIPCSGAVNPISDSPNVDPWDLGMIFVKLLFLVFLVGVSLFLEERRNRRADIPILVHSDGLYGHLGREDFA